MPPGELSKIFKTCGPLDPVLDAEIYVERPELDKLLRAVQDPAAETFIALFSSPQTGRTTLLYQLRSRLRQRGYCVPLISLSILCDLPEGDVYRRVAGEILSELEPILALGTRAHSRGELPSSAAQFREFLLETARETKAERLIILVDDAESLPDRLADAFFGVIRDVFAGRSKREHIALEKYLFVISSSRELHRLSAGPSSPLDILERIYLSDLTLDGAGTIVSNFARAAISTPIGTTQWVYDQTRGHPYLTQKLCSQIEQFHPGVITQDLVTRASVQLLKTDDHLETMLLQIDSEPETRHLLEQIMSARSIPFSRPNPTVAHLELTGAIRDAGRCAIRNPIYYAAFRSHFNMTPIAEPTPAAPRGVRLAVFAIAFLLFLLNLPFLYTYYANIYSASRSVDDRLLTRASIGSDLTIRYNPILSANSPDSNDITISVEEFTAGGAFLVTFQPGQSDIALDGAMLRRLEPSSRQARYEFTLRADEQPILQYNPFNLRTDRRQITLVFQRDPDNRRRAVYTADFVVDHSAAFAVAAGVSVLGLVVALGALFLSAGLVQRIWRIFRRQSEENE